jgi:long-chain fatty acid transport protein
MANSQLAAGGVPSQFWYNNIKSQDIEAESFYYGFTFGGAFAFTDAFSMSLGARYIDATRIDAEGAITISAPAWTLPVPPQNGDLTAEAKWDETANGWGGIIGFNVAPVEQFNMGIRYETETRLNFETDVKRDVLVQIPGSPGILAQLGVIDGEKNRRDLPALLGVGFDFNITPQFRLETDLTYYFNDDAKWVGNMTSQNGLLGLPNTERDNGFDVGIALEYAFTDQWAASFGYMFTETGIDPDNMAYEAPELDAHSIGWGLKWSPIPLLDLNLSALKTFYLSETTTPIPGVFPNGVELKKDVFIVAFGAQLNF